MPEGSDDRLVSSARQLIAASRYDLADRTYVEQTIKVLKKSNALLAAMRMRAYDDLFVTPHAGPAEPKRIETRPEAQPAISADARSGEAVDGRNTLNRKTLSVSQRRGLARKITSYLKRSGLDCHFIDDQETKTRMLN